MIAPSSNADAKSGTASRVSARSRVLPADPNVPFEVSAAQLLVNEADVLGSKAFTAGEIGEALEICARGEVWPLVTETYALEDANSVHERLEAEAIIGRAAIVM